MCYFLASAAFRQIEPFRGNPLLQARMPVALLPLILTLTTLAVAQNQVAVDASLPPPPHEKQIRLKRILVVSQTKGFEHDSITDGMVAIYSMGRESGLWDTVL